MKLIIFDLDQTLVEFLTVHDEAARQLFKNYFNVEARLTEIDYAGKSLHDSFRQLASLKNISEERFLNHKEELLKSYETAFTQNLPENASAHILPGVEKLLAGLSAMGHILMLYTGDSRGIVDSVFKTTGLGKYFKACFYGTEVNQRADMVVKAINGAKELTGSHFTGKDIVIVGDSIRDIEVGKKFNALIIAVATGIYSQDELGKAGASYIFPDLSDYDAVVGVINQG